MIKNKSDRTKLIEMINLAEMDDKKVEKDDYKLKQNHYAAKSKLGKVFYASSEKGTYVKPKQK